MSKWYYSKSGQQIGPVELDDLRELVRSGAVDGSKELAWTSGMGDWMPIGRIGELSAPAAATHEAPMVVTPGQGDNPYAAPASAWAPPEPEVVGDRQEIEPGSDPLDPIACLKRGWELLAANVGAVAAVFVVYVLIAFGIAMIGGLLETNFGVSAEEIGTEIGTYGFTERAAKLILGSSLIQIVMGVPSLWLGLGLIRAMLSLVDGKDASVGMLFGEGSKLLRAVGAMILYYLIVIPGLLLLIVPGIYLAMRLYFSYAAIVDRNMGVMESLSYSWRITGRNGLPLLAFWVLAFMITIAGALLCLVGLIVAVPWVTLAGLLVFRWLQYGRRGLQPQARHL